MTTSAPLPQMLCLGINYRTAPVAVRECFSVPKSKQEAVNRALRDLPGVEECVLLSTCNRTEVYYWSHSPAESTEALVRFFRTMGRADAAFYSHTGREALLHLAEVAGGLDSMVIGETEIFGQLKDAYRCAAGAGTTAGCANRSFQRVFSIAKKVRTITKITSGPTSVGAAAVQLARDFLGKLSGSTVLVVGAGEVARTTAQSLKSRGAESIFVANRSYDKAVELAAGVGGRVIRFADWVPYLEHIDIVIVSTASPAYVVAPKVLAPVQQARGERPLFIIDLSVPRNADPACAEVPGVYVYDIDALRSLARRTEETRRGELAEARRLLLDWLQEEEFDLLVSHREHFISPT